jgi:hypothetical protein
MTTSTVIFSGTPTMIYLAIFLLVGGGLALMWYALREKGDVSAQISHGRTIFKLEAKEKYSDRGKRADSRRHGLLQKVEDASAGPAVEQPILDHKVSSSNRIGS